MELDSEKKQCHVVTTSLILTLLTQSLLSWSNLQPFLPPFSPHPLPSFTPANGGRNIEF